MTLQNVTMEICPKCNKAMNVCSINYSKIIFYCPNCVKEYYYTMCKKCGEIYKEDKFKLCNNCRENAKKILEPIKKTL
jgi:RecJ-like exonuclease